MLRLFRLTAAAALTFGALALFAPTAGAYSVFHNSCTDSNGNATASTSAACSSQNSQETISGPNGLLARITKVVAIVAGIASVILIVISGLFFVTAEGDPAKAKGARSTLIGALVGIVIVLAAQGIITFVLSRIP